MGRVCVICGKEAGGFDFDKPYCLEHGLDLKKAIWEGLGLEWKPEIPEFMFKLHPELLKFKKVKKQ